MDCRLLVEWVVIKAQELSMHWASNFSFRSCSRWYLTDLFNLEHKTTGFVLVLLPIVSSDLIFFPGFKTINVRKSKKSAYFWDPLYRVYTIIPGPSPLPYLLSDLLYHTLQKGGHALDNLPLLQQLSVHLIVQPLRWETFHSAGRRTKVALMICFSLLLLHLSHKYFDQPSFFSALWH